MKRIMLIGAGGAGKSTLARALGAAIGAPVVHLDALYWLPGWQRCETEEFRRRVTQAHAGDAWISDGNFSLTTFDIRVPRAEAILWLDQTRLVCISRAILRWVTNWGGSRADLAPGCPEKFDPGFLQWIWNFQNVQVPLHRQQIEDMGATARFHRLDGDRGARAYLSLLTP